MSARPYWPQSPAYRILVGARAVNVSTTDRASAYCLTCQCELGVFEGRYAVDDAKECCTQHRIWTFRWTISENHQTEVRQ
jgi:hypothetical protein